MVLHFGLSLPPDLCLGTTEERVLVLVLLSGWPGGLGLDQDVTPPGGGVCVSLSTLLVLVGVTMAGALIRHSGGSWALIFTSVLVGCRYCDPAFSSGAMAFQSIFSPKGPWLHPSQPSFQTFLEVWRARAPFSCASSQSVLGLCYPDLVGALCCYIKGKE